MSSSANSLITNAFNAYVKLTEKPIAFAVFIVACLSIVAEYNNTNGPFELLRDILEDFVRDKSHSKFLITIATLLLSLLKIIVAYKSVVFLYMLIIIIPIVYIDRDTIIVVAALAFYTTVSTNTPIMKTLVIQAVFIYYSLDGFFDRILVFSAILYIVFGSDKLSTMFGVASNT